MASTALRSFIKGVTWETSGLVVLYLLTKSIKVSLSYLIIRVALYWLHERLWKKARWGKTRRKENEDS